MEIPVYLFSGFMDSGKTTLIRQTLIEEDFTEGARTLLIVCEDGDEEYDEALLAAHNIKVVYVEQEEDFCELKLNQWNKEFLIAVISMR